MHRQKLPPWVSPKTSNLIKILETKQKQFDSRPTPHLQETITNFENSLMQNMELERVEYQESILVSRNTNLIFKHFKNLKKQKSSLPREMELNIRSQLKKSKN